MISLGLLYWLIMLMVLLFWGWTYRVPNAPYDYRGFSGSLVLWVLLAIVGYKLFGSPLGN